MTFEKVAAAIAKKTGLDVSGIKPETSFKDLLSDSLDTVDVLMNLEDVFNVQLQMSTDMLCVGDVVTQIDQQDAQK